MGNHKDYVKKTMQTSPIVYNLHNKKMFFFQMAFPDYYTVLRMDKIGFLF